MANRNHDYSYQSGSRGGSQNWRDEDERNDEGRSQFGRSRERDTDEQGGSTGRYAGHGDFGRGEYGGRSGWSGQERQGQSGYGRSGSSERDYGQGGGYGYGGGGQQRERYGQGGQRSGGAEPYGESQQYTPGGQYGGRGVGDDWGSQQRGYGSQGYGRPQQSYGLQGHGPQGYGSQEGYGGRGTGEHFGKGPKGYQRSDERTKELLCERLRDDPEIDPSEVTITVQGGKITLEGTVDSRRTKNAIEEIADQFGTQDVQNNLRIQRTGQQSADAQGRQARGAAGEDTTMKQKHN